MKTLLKTFFIVLSLQISAQAYEMSKVHTPENIDKTLTNLDEKRSPHSHPKVKRTKMA